MPMLKFRGIPKEEIIIESKKLVDEIAEIVECPRDYFTLEVMDNLFVMDGKVVDAPTIVEVAWFGRGQEVQDKVANVITTHFKKDRECLDVFFVNLEYSDYYENGKHF